MAVEDLRSARFRASPQRGAGEKRRRAPVRFPRLPERGRAGCRAAVAPAEPGAFRRTHGLGADDRVVLFLGRIHEYKGLDVLLRAFAQVRAEQSNVRLVIAGRDDGYLDTARRLAAELTSTGSVVFSGP